MVALKIGSFQLYPRGFIFLFHKYFTLFAYVELQNSGKDTINWMITANHKGTYICSENFYFKENIYHGIVNLLWEDKPRFIK